MNVNLVMNKILFLNYHVQDIACVLRDDIQVLPMGTLCNEVS